MPLTPPGVVGAEKLSPYSGAAIDENEPTSVIICFDITAFIVSKRSLESSHGLIIPQHRAMWHWLLYLHTSCSGHR